jgi:hypothetical protein
MTTLTITPTTNKGAQLTGVMAVAESVEVTAVGLGAYIADPNVLRLRVLHRGEEIARFPLEVEDVWTADGDDATCTLTLNTVEALAIFATCRNTHATKTCHIFVELTDPNTLFVAADFELRNWPQVEGEDVPHDVTEWPDALADAVAAHDALESEYDAHTHGDGDPAQVDHGDLLNKGTVSHADLEAALTAVESDVTTAEGNIGTLQTEMDAAEALLAAHNHNGSGSQQLSHAGLTGIGTRTHAQLEADTAAVDAKVDANKALYDAHEHNGTDAPEIPIASIDGWAAMLARLEAVEAAVEALTAALAVLDAEAVKKATTLYTVTAPSEGTYRNINENMTGDQLARSIPTIVADLQAKGVL